MGAGRAVGAQPDQMMLAEVLRRLDLDHVKISARFFAHFSAGSLISGGRLTTFSCVSMYGPLIRSMQ